MGTVPAAEAGRGIRHAKPEYCSLCREFPCERYQNMDEFDSFISHRNRKKDLKKRDKIGTEEYQREQQEKLAILNWLLQNYNDGRKKSFFCLAVNLLELQDVRAVKQQIIQDDEINRRPIKEKASRVKKLLEDKANEQQIVLKLRKKKRDAG